VRWIGEQRADATSSHSPCTSHVRAHNGERPFIRIAARRGVELAGLGLDTAIAAYLIDPAETRYSIADLLVKYTDYQLDPEDPVVKGQLDFGDTVDHHTRAGAEALAVTHLANALASALDKQGMAELYATMENPLVVVLARMEHVGVGVDERELRALNAKLTADCERLAGELQQVVGRPFNFNSPIQLRDILYTERGLSPGRRPRPATRRTRRRSRSCAISGRSSSTRCCSTAKSRSCGAPTARASSPRSRRTGGSTRPSTRRWRARDGSAATGPNLHNIPVRRDEGRQFRKVFVPRRTPSCSSPTTTRSSCAASRTSRRTPV
jgi:DNA polymerase-1